MLVYSVKPSQKPRQLWARRTTFLRRLFNRSRTVSNLIYGHLACFFTKCARCSHHLMRKVFINLPEKSLSVNIMMCPIISARISQISYKECLMLTQKRGPTLTQSLDTQSLRNVFKSFLQKTISEMSSPILFCTTRTYSMNSRQSKLPRKKRKRKSKSWQLRRRRERSKGWMSCVLMSTSPSTDKIRSSLMRCSCTTSTNCTNPMNKAVIRPRLATQRPFRSDRSHSRPR